MCSASTTTALRRSALLLGLGLATGGLAPGLSGGPAVAASTRGPCRQDTTGTSALRHLKWRLVQFGGEAADSLQVVTNSATCAAVIAAYNRIEVPEYQVTDAYVLRRGSAGFVLISPKRLNYAAYFSRTWEYIASEVGI